MKHISIVEIGEVERAEDGWEVVGCIGGERGNADHEHTVKIGDDIAASLTIEEIRMVGARAIFRFVARWMQTDESGEESVTEFFHLPDLDVLTAAEREGLWVDIVGGAG